MILFILDVNPKYGVSPQTLIDYKCSSGLIIPGVAEVFALMNCFRDLARLNILGPKNRFEGRVETDQKINAVSGLCEREASASGCLGHLVIEGCHLQTVSCVT